MIVSFVFKINTHIEKIFRSQNTIFYRLDQVVEYSMRCYLLLSFRLIAIPTTRNTAMRTYRLRMYIFFHRVEPQSASSGERTVSSVRTVAL